MIHLALLVLMLSACNLGAPNPQSPDQLATSVAATLAALSTNTTAPASATPSLTPTATVTPTPAPTANNLPAATRIVFASGATQRVVNDSVAAGNTEYYVAGAADGQILIVMLDNPSQDNVLSVFGADGSLLLDDSSGASAWQGVLPAGQDYYFGVHGQSTETYTLNVIIAAPIHFAAGETEITFSGSTTGGYAVTYYAYAFVGQELEVDVNTDPADASLTIYGFSDGQPYARAQNGVTDFEMTLPSTQYYIIEVVPQGGREIDYQLKIEIN
jgi:hypothetical protein